MIYDIMLPAVLAITHTLTTGLPTYDCRFFPTSAIVIGFPKREMVTQHGGECGIIFFSGLAAKGLILGNFWFHVG